MFIGHINLSPSFNSAGEHFVGLIEALRRRNVRQYILVRNTALAKRLDLIEDVTVGPVVRSAVSACCLMPCVDVLHVHDQAARAAGLLSRLTKSTPFVLNTAISIGKDNNPLSLAAMRRASGFVNEDEIDADEHLRLYRQAVETVGAPPVLL